MERARFECTSDDGKRSQILDSRNLEMQGYGPESMV